MKTFFTLLNGIESIVYKHHGKWLTILVTPLVLWSFFFLSACGPKESIQNNYNQTTGGVGKSSNSNLSGGGGATGDGGGGQGILCGDIDKPELKDRLVVRDLYEAIHNHKRKLKSISLRGSGTEEVSGEAISVLTKSIKQFFGASSRTIEFARDAFWIEFAKKIVFIEAGRELHLSHDANSPIALEDECKIVQIAYWDESIYSGDGILYVSRPLWNKLDQLNRIALLAHEFFYRQARKANFKNSDAVRYKVGQLLSVEGIPSLFESWEPGGDPRIREFVPKSKNGFKYCEGRSSNDISAYMQFYQYEGKDQKQHFVFPTITSSQINLPFLARAHFSFDTNDKQSESLVIATDTMTSVGGADLDTMMDSNFLSADFFERGNDLRWNLKSGQLLNELGSKTLAVELMKKLVDMPKSLWTGVVKEAISPVAIELLNPVSDRFSAEKSILKSRENLMIETSNELVLILNRCGIWDESVATSAVLVLDKEIRDAIDGGKYPHGFPNFEAFLKSFKQEKDKFEFGCPLKDQSKRLNGLVKLKLDITMGKYDRSDIARYLQGKGFEGVAERSQKFVQMSVSQDNKHVVFDMRCNNFPSVVSDVFNSDVASSNTSFRDKHVAGKFEDLNRAIEEVGPQTEPSDDTEASVQEFVEKRNNLQKLVEKIQSMKEFSFHTTLCDSGEGNRLCSEYKSFKSHLEDETSVVISSCDLNLIYAAKYYRVDLQSNHTCALVEMKTLNRVYMIYFDYPKRRNSESNNSTLLSFVQQQLIEK